ncbi:MAG: hypothetical protein ABI947_07925 [Chloroflexota bacterium]
MNNNLDEQYFGGSTDYQNSDMSDEDDSDDGQMLSAEQAKDQASDDVRWQHIDYYVRRVDDGLVLVETLLRIDPDGVQEICTFYIDIDQLNKEWVQAVWEQSEGLEEGKSADFVPPDELYFYDSGIADEEDEL